MRTAALTPQTRQDALEVLAASGQGNELDILVIGGGVTGAGIALDAVTRGLRVGIVEAQDWSSGTSSRSSKLVHGGLRYLQMLDFHLVHEALTERDLLLKKIAPHLVRPVSFLYPLEHAYWERAYVGAGVALYDTLASIAPGKRAMPWHRHVSRSGMEQMFPDLRHDAAVGAVRYYDASVDDARLVSTLVRTAVSYGAYAASRTQVVELTKRGTGVVDGAVLVDLETGNRFTCRADQVINATGVWTEDTEALAGTDGGLHVLASKGIHIVVPRERIRGEVGLILQTEKSVLFVIPWSRYWIIGTTDTPWKQELVHPVATSTDIDYVIEHANAVLSTPLTRDDVIGVWAGLRPLLQPGTKEGTSSAKVSREHTVASPTPGLTVIAGGKLTTYRVMAKDAVDFAHRRARREPAVADRPDPARRGRGPRGAAAPGPPDRAALRLDLRDGRPPAAPLRRSARRDHGLRGRRPLPRPSVGGRPGLPACRGRLRRHPRGRPAPRGRHAAPDPTGLRAARSRARGDRGDRRPGRGAAGLGRRQTTGGDRLLPGALRGGRSRRAGAR